MRTAVLLLFLLCITSCNNSTVLPLNSHPRTDSCKCWKNLFEDNLSNAEYQPNSWEDINGVLVRKGGGDIWTQQKYGNFILDLEFKVAKGTNSGVFIRADNNKNWQDWIEVQIHETKDRSEHGQCGAIYDCLSPSENMLKETGQWNRMTIAAVDNRINIVINNKRVIDMDLDLWTEPGKNPDGTKNKYKRAFKDMPRFGYIGFQDHHSPIWFRNIRIKSLDR